MVFFPSSPVQGRTSRRGDHTELLQRFDVPPPGVGCMDDNVGGLPRMFLPPHSTFQGTAGSTTAHQQTLSTLEPKCLRILEANQYRDSPLRPTHQPTGKRHDAVSCANSQYRCR